MKCQCGRARLVVKNVSRPGAAVFADKCIAGITANRKACSGYIEKSLALVTALVPEIGYDGAAAIAKKAYETGRTIREIAVEEDILPADEIDKLLGS